MDINEEAYAIQEEVVEFRRALHRCPEIAFHETMTMEYIREHLEEWEISYKIFDPSGIIAVVGNGKKETIALRADMDALEVQEETGLDFASLNHGCMHACGHDGHTAILLATAKILKKHESELDRISCISACGRNRRRSQIHVEDRSFGQCETHLWSPYF